MYSSIFISGCLLLAIGVSAQEQCRFSMPFHQIVSALDGVLTIDDEDGSRQIKGTVFNSVDCNLNPSFPTGRAFTRFPNMTSLAQDGSNPNSCETKVSGSDYTIDSFQAIVIEANGWPLHDLTFNISDIDGASGAREAAAVFGLRNGGLVLPNIVLPQDSNLTQQSFVMPEASNSQLGLNLGTVSITGVLLRDPVLTRCPFLGGKEIHCVVTVSFPVPVDSFVVIYILQDSGTISGKTLSLLSPFSTSCGCRCRESNPGPREVTVPVLGGPGECTRKEASGPKIECDVLGGRWCEKEPKSEYVLTGNILPNGNLGCTETDGSKASVLQEFTPDPNFAGTV